MPPSSSDESSELSLKSAVRSASMLASCDDEEDDAEGLEDSRCMGAVGDLAASIGIPTRDAGCIAVIAQIYRQSTRLDVCQTIVQCFQKSD